MGIKMSLPFNFQLHPVLCVGLCEEISTFSKNSLKIPKRVIRVRKSTKRYHNGENNGQRSTKLKIE